MDLKKKLVRAFVETGAFKWDKSSPFVLASGVKSEYYVDCRRFLSDPVNCVLVAEAAYLLVSSLGITAVGGLVLGAVPLSTSLAIVAHQRSNGNEHWRTFMVRKESKSYGLGNLIEGDLRAGDQVLIVDDVLTSGNSIVRTLESLTRSDLSIRVDHVLVLVDRQEQNGRQNLERQYGVKIHSILMLDELKLANTMFTP
tara:strand:+ start:2919 stop:3512 length:594 start_codon:yes stop_codon:yes gene_type:complete